MSIHSPAGDEGVTDLTIRPATVADLPRLVAILVDDPIGAERETLADPLPERYRDAFARIDASPDSTLYVAELGRRTVGMAQLNLLQYLTYLGGRRGQVDTVFVAADARGRGIGTALVRHCLEAADAAGCHLVQLFTDARREDAVRFYERLGFEATHRGMKRHRATDSDS